MKTSLFILLIVAKTAVAQEIVLLDRSFRKPIAVTQNVTAAQLQDRKFPIYVTDLDSVIKIIENLANHINTGAVHEGGTQMLAVGHSQFSITTYNKQNYNNYSIHFSTQSGDLGASVKLVKQEDNTRKAVQRLRIFLDYLKNNQHILEQEK